MQGKDQWDEKTAPVGSFFPNGYGLYDMAGNVYEWCADRYTMPIHHIKTQKGLNQALKASEYCEVDLGTTLRAIPYVVD